MSTKEEQVKLLQLPIMEFLTLFFITISIFALGNFANTVMDHYKMSAVKAEWQAKIDQEEAEQQRLLKQKELVASDAYQRQLAHELGLYAPDEQPLVLILPPELQEDVNEFNPIYREGIEFEPPYWQQWWDLFFGEEK